jgi:hypothetical protein
MMATVDAQNDPMRSSEDDASTRIGPGPPSILAPAEIHQPESVQGSRASMVDSSKLDALSYLDPDSPVVTEERIKRTVAEAATWRPPFARPSSASASTLLAPEKGSRPKTPPIAQMQDGEEGEGVTPRPSRTRLDGLFIAADAASVHSMASSYIREQKRGPRQERWHASQALNGSLHSPRPQNPFLQPLPPQHHNPDEDNVRTGYALLATSLAASSGARRMASPMSSSMNSNFPITLSLAGRHTSPTHSRQSSRPTSNGTITATRRHQADSTMPLRPIYRRFEALNHRLLLHLQDELAELEEQLDSLDAADSQRRRIKLHIIPSSRRAEAAGGGEVQWHRTDILGKIGFKMDQYSKQWVTRRMHLATD